MEARNSTTWGPSAARMPPTSWRLRRCAREFALAEAAEVDDPPDPLLPRGAGEVPGAGPVLLLEVAGGAHRVHKVVGGVDAVQRGGQGLGVQDVPLHDLGPRTKTTREVLGAARQAADPVAARLEGRHQPASHVTARPGDEDEGGCGRIPGWDDWRPLASRPTVEHFFVVVA